jgi:hypothetical protein
MGRTVSSGVHLAEASHRHAKRSNTDKPRAAPSDPPAGLACHDDATIGARCGAADISPRDASLDRRARRRQAFRISAGAVNRRGLTSGWRRLRAQFDNANFVVRSPQASGWDGRRFGWTDFEK